LLNGSSTHNRWQDDASSEEAVEYLLTVAAVEYALFSSENQEPLADPLMMSFHWQSLSALQSAFVEIATHLAIAAFLELYESSALIIAASGSAFDLASLWVHELPLVLGACCHLCNL
jgi:hypothetical protein